MYNNNNTSFYKLFTIHDIHTYIIFMYNYRVFNLLLNEIVFSLYSHKMK